MVAVASLLTILLISILVTRIATVALAYTGLSRQSARFQARSAFTGVGFTTAESEQVVNHPVRRRILMLLMLLGNAGVVAAIGSIVVTYVDSDDRVTFLRGLTILALGVALLWVVASSRWVDNIMTPVITWGLRRWTDIDVRDYAQVLHVGGEYRVAELYVEDEGWLAGRTLADLELRREGITVLGVERAGGSYLGVPRGDTELHEKDTLVLYGRVSSLAELRDRHPGAVGAKEHRKAVEDQERVAQEERRVDR